MEHQVAGNMSLRDFIGQLRAAGELITITKPVHPRHLSALVAQAYPKAILFQNIVGYDMPLLADAMADLDKIALGLGVEVRMVGRQVMQATMSPIGPRVVERAPVQEVVLTGSDVDLTRFPLPLQGALDGAPYISAGLIVARDPEYGENNSYARLMFNDQNLLGVGITSPSDLRAFYDRALAKERSLPVAVVIGVHPIEAVAGTFKASVGTDEFGIAGALRGQPVELVRCKTIPIHVPAHAEIILEGEMLPTGYSVDEGRFGEFTGFTGPVVQMPLLRVTAITHRRGAIFQSIHMPWENVALDQAVYEASAWKVLAAAGVETVAINVTKGGAGQFHVIASIRKRPGEGKNAVLALLSSALFKYAVVVDDDIDPYDLNAVDWAVFSRVQADRDVIVITGARAKPLDPSVKKGVTQGLPTTAKLGIDATYPEDIPRHHYARISYPFLDEVKLSDYLDDSGEVQRLLPTAKRSVSELSAAILDMAAARPVHFVDILDALRDENYREILLAFGEIRRQRLLKRDDQGRYVYAS